MRVSIGTGPRLHPVAGYILVATLVTLFSTQACLAKTISKTELAPGRYEYLGMDGKLAKPILFNVLNDKTAIFDEPLKRVYTRHPLWALKPGIYNQLHMRVMEKGPKRIDREQFEILADGSLRTNSEEGPSPFEDGSEIVTRSQSPYEEVFKKMDKPASTP
jgi:hypothetical protein